MPDPAPLGGGAAAGYSGTPLAKKLGITASARVALIDAPADLDATLGPLPDGTTVARRLGPADVVLFFTTSRADLERRRDRARHGDLPRRRDLGLLAEEGGEGPHRRDRGRRARGGAPARPRRRQGLRGRRRVVGPAPRVAHGAPGPAVTGSREIGRVTRSPPGRASRPGPASGGPTTPPRAGGAGWRRSRARRRPGTRLPARRSPRRSRLAASISSICRWAIAGGAAFCRRSIPTTVGPHGDALAVRQQERGPQLLARAHRLSVATARPPTLRSTTVVREAGGLGP